MRNRIINYFNKIKSEYGQYKRLYKLFWTELHPYIYDVGTGKVLECTEIEYRFLSYLIKYENIEKALMEIDDDSENIITIDNMVNILQEQHLLQAPIIKKFDIDVEKTLEEANINLSQITLELTQKCNMSCKYCIYQSNNIDFREFGTNSMTWDVAKCGIDYILNHSSNELAITFYGGEPLLEIDLIRRCVEYSKANALGKNISYSLTTNLTLMTEEIASYLSSIPEFSIVCSIDGSKNIHDKYRVFPDGKGTFDKALNGLHILVSAYGNRAANLISLSVVQAGVITKEKMEENHNFFNSLDWLPSNICKRISYVRTSSDVENKVLTESEKCSYSNPICDWTIDTLLNVNNSHIDSIFTNEFLEMHLIRIHNRMLTDKPVSHCYMNGCCLPASRKLYISVNGDFYVCERIGKSPSIGNVYDGLNKDCLTNKYMNDYCKESIPKCSQCWAVRLCPICFTDCYDDEKFRIDFKNIACIRTMFMIEQDLVYYHTILERKPHILERLNHMSLT